MMGINSKQLSAINFRQYIQKKTLHHHFADEEFDEVFGKYKQYSKKTSEGVHGKTDQFSFSYIEMLHLYHEFIRCIQL